MTARYAIYHIPGRDTALDRFGRSWLGWDIRKGEPVPLTPLAGFEAAERDALVRTPRQYGFHATLKAPMALAPGMTIDGLLAAAENFATRTAPGPVLDLKLSTLGNFLSLGDLAQRDPLQNSWLEVAFLKQAYKMIQVPFSLLHVSLPVFKHIVFICALQDFEDVNLAWNFSGANNWIVISTAWASQ